MRVFTLTAERGSLSWQCIYWISPIGGGADGEGVEDPPPCLLSQPLNGVHRPPPCEMGAGECMMIAPDGRARGEERDPDGGSTETLVDALPGGVSIGTIATL